MEPKNYKINLDKLSPICIRLKRSASKVQGGKHVSAAAILALSLILWPSPSLRFLIPAQCAVAADSSDDVR